MSLKRVWLDLSLKWKLLILGCIGVVVMGITALLVSGKANREIGGQVKATLLNEAEGQGKMITEGVLNMVKTQDQLLGIKLQGDLAVARNLIESAGGINFALENVSWKAVNQGNQQAQDVSLPKLMVGSEWLGQNTSLTQKTPIVDKVKDMVGGACTIFQRMNTQGDMLRVATNVPGADGNRAIGTYI